MANSKKFLTGLAGAAVMSVTAFGSISVTQALAFEPNKPVNFIIMAGKGGGADKMARLMQAIIEKEKLVTASASFPPTSPVVLVPKH